jgi:hypothetical protein
VTSKKNPEIEALQSVYEALKELSPDVRTKVLKSVFALLGLEHFALEPSAAQIRNQPQGEQTHISEQRPSTFSEGDIGFTGRQKSLMELMLEKNPATNTERITLFAYYRERFEGNSRFDRADLEPYFAKAKVSPPGNYARDFNEAVKRGWIHEDGSDSYITSRGIEAVESGFTSQKATTPKKKGSSKSKKQSNQKRSSSK